MTSKRLTAVITLVFATLSTPLAADAQQSAKVQRIGLLEHGSSDSARLRLWDALRHRLREPGYVEGENIAVEARWADGKVEQLANLAAELVQLKVGLSSLRLEEVENIQVEHDRDSDLRMSIKLLDRGKISERGALGQLLPGPA